jgi:hypothetical protein
MTPPMHKYPRTHHIEGSRLQPGDEDLDSVPFAAIAGRFLVVEEKVDGANAALRFDGEGALLLQSRGHYLQGGAREKHFDLFKQWASTHADALRERLQDRFVLYGEWLYAKHTVFYDALPHYFLEFDVLDTQGGVFLSTARRRALLDGAPVASVPVLSEGALRSRRALTALVRRSAYKSERWTERLSLAAAARDVDVDRVLRETDPSDQMEGLYIKVEDEERVVERYKYIRRGFLTSVIDSGTHWLKRPIVPNELAPGVDLFAGAT